MKECMACKEDIKDGARKCPHCHQVQSTIARFGFSRSGQLLGVAIVLFAVAWFVYSVLYPFSATDLGAQFEITQGEIELNTEKDPVIVNCITKVNNSGLARWTDFSLQAEYFDAAGSIIDVHYQKHDIGVFPMIGFSARVTGTANSEIRKYISCKVSIIDADNF